LPETGAGASRYEARLLRRRSASQSGLQASCLPYANWARSADTSCTVPQTGHRWSGVAFSEEYDSNELGSLRDFMVFIAKLLCSRGIVSGLDNASYAISLRKSGEFQGITDVLSPWSGAVGADA
jgi:hypothetical protein